MHLKAVLNSADFYCINLLFFKIVQEQIWGSIFATQLLRPTLHYSC